MSNTVHPAAQQGFSAAAALYQQVRPNYPQAIIHWLQQDLQLGSAAKVIDLGAGTGKFLDYLSQVSMQILAVEPVSAMLEQLSQQHPQVDTLQAQSDQLTQLPAQQFDAVLCAQSFHWFATPESLQSIHHVLKPGAALGLVWNQRDESVPWVKALADLLAEYETDTPRFHNDAWTQVFEQQDLFQFVAVQHFKHQHQGRVEDVVSKRLLSTSFIAAMPEAEQLALKHQFEQIVAQHTGKGPQDQIVFPYVTYAFHYRKI